MTVIKIKKYTICMVARQWGAFKASCAHRDISIKSRLEEMIQSDIDADIKRTAGNEMFD